MLCAFPVFKNDAPKLLDLIKWIRQLGGCSGHQAVIVADAGTPAGRVFQIRDETRKCFDSVEIITTSQSINGWPEGPNDLFLTTARFAKQRNMHWLFLEPDAVPLRAGWIDKLDIKYRVTGARYMGQIVPCTQAGLPSRHFTGVGIYPPDAIDDVEEAVTKNPKIAFDLVTADRLVPQAYHCDLFQHLWGEFNNPPTFAKKRIPGTGTFDLGYLRKDAVLFHRNKDGKLIRLLREVTGFTDKTPSRFPYIQLGRFGDIILLLPAMKYLAETTGVIPKMIVSQDYVSVLEGVSYVEAIPLPVHWYMGMPQAIKFAEIHFGGSTVLQCYAHQWGINLKQWPSFMISMLDRTGVPLELFNHLPLEFDLRNPKREAACIPRTNGKPYIAINTAGVSSPFHHGQKIFDMLRHLTNRVTLIDMSRIHCHRIYDLLGVMDHAVGVITTDTATLHLAHGSIKPYIALTVDGWCTSTPRGKCVLEIKYSKFMSSLSTILRTVESWL